MSVLNKKPYAQKVIESLGQADLEALASAINGCVTWFNNYFEKGDYNVVKSDEGKLIRIKGERMMFPNATELKTEPKEY